MQTASKVITMKAIHGEAFWVAILCSIAVRHRRFGGPGCLHLHLKCHKKWN